MRFEPQEISIKQLTTSWKNRSLAINIEYQRGAAWSTVQMQGLVDSVFRKYPIPPVFLNRIESNDPLTGQAIRLEVVDGQQRLRALSEFSDDQFPLLKPDDKKLRLPNSLRKIPAIWGGRNYSQLDNELKEQFNETKVNAFIISAVSNPDEIRDLFIRLQSGTALSRQQVRDAWPGNVGPFIEQLAGKLKRLPQVVLFGLVDARGIRTEDDDIDRYSSGRQLCAQLLKIYLTRIQDPLNFPSVTADELDKVYHDYTSIDENGAACKRFVELLNLTQNVLMTAILKRSPQGRAKYKFRKLEVFAVFLLFQDLLSNPNIKFDKKFLGIVAEHIGSSHAPTPGKALSGPAIGSFYATWRTGLPEALAIRLDPKRLFDEHQKQLLRKAARGNCQICGTAIPEDEGEFDHYPTPHYLGGRTEFENGRLVCQACHPRGRPEPY